MSEIDAEINLSGNSTSKIREFISEYLIHWSNHMIATILTEKGEFWG